MQEVAAPDGQRIEDKERDILHLAQRGDALPDTLESVFYLIIYRQLAYQVIAKAHGHDATEGSDKPSGGGELAKRRVESGACAGKEDVENAKLAHESDQGHDGDKQRVDGALCDHRAQCLGKGDSVVAPQYAAACYLADAGNDQAHGVGEKHGVEADRPAWPLAHRLQCLAPSPSPECLSQHPERQ